MDDKSTGSSVTADHLGLRRRQTTPVTKEEITTIESTTTSNSNKNTKGKKGMPYLQAQVVHYKARVSVLDKELTTVSYHGLVNFLLLLLTATLVRLAIENYMKYGILVEIPGNGILRRDWIATLTGVLAVAASFFVALAIERKAIPTEKERQQQKMASSASASASASLDSGERLGVPKQEKRILYMHLANLLFVLVVPACITYFAIFQPALGTAVMALACIMFLKLYSLAATNFDLRRAYRLGDKGLDSDPLVVKDKGGSSSSSSSANSSSASSSSASSSSTSLPGISAEVDSREKMVNGIVPAEMRKSFSHNARALDGFYIDGDDRTDAKADALPTPRMRQRSVTATGTKAAEELAKRIAGAGAGAGGGGSEVSKAKVPRDRIHYAVSYPDNVTFRNFGYFWLAPTLCYQPAYPRTAGPVRKSFVAKRVGELVVLCLTMFVIIQQYAVPTLVGSVKAIDQRDGFWLSERVLKLSVTSAIVWFLGFYAIFHAGLNAMAELLRFSDRAFYLDWWNSVDLGAYWREWNLPIHYFCKRHIMVPLVSAPLSLPVNVGVALTFLVSAIMHELLFGIPTHCLHGYSFVGMMMQIPLIQLTQWLVRWRGPDSGLGNAVFWISFCIVGQPLGVVQYYYSWIKHNQ